ncbi:NYN domain-containing protein [Enterococcus diestrammenae]|uniref:DNA-binding protein n=1 Tax=Enterococcus diestrammenae TaxID=1155073 RepID=A0ABV0EXS3_9ENTE|nr:NYN domain-containing protein [Enterococcus diestrammenae]KAF1298355.1 DNA-binding protein [Enterococcus diestrammenae]
MKKQLLIVDGYNMIGAWPELVLLKKQDKMEDARDALLNRLSNFAKYEGTEIIVVFDAQFVPGITTRFTKYQLEVVFTEEGETADSYIERVAGELNTRLTQVTVATSDLAEQWVVFSQGALRTSARELYKTIEKTEKQIAGHQEDLKFADFRRNSPWTADQLAELGQKLAELSSKRDNSK